MLFFICMKNDSFSISGYTLFSADFLLISQCLSAGKAHIYNTMVCASTLSLMNTEAEGENWAASSVV